jgi:hypothetical protein
MLLSSPRRQSLELGMRMCWAYAILWVGNTTVISWSPSSVLGRQGKGDVLAVGRICSNGDILPEIPY